MKYGIKFIENQKMKEGNFLIMEKLNKTLKNSEKAITLIALVVTIIVLLILAGVSISMLTGENGILSRSAQASKETVHANVYEQLQLKAADYFVEKNLGNTTEQTLIEHLQKDSNKIIGEELGEGSGKYQINVENLLGTKQKYGNGTATGSDTSTYKDVYMLERVETEEPEDPESGSIVNTKVASTKPIKIASTSTNQVTYIVKYYGNTTSEDLTLGNFVDINSINSNATEQFGYCQIDEEWVFITREGENPTDGKIYHEGDYYTSINSTTGENEYWVFAENSNMYQYYYNSTGQFIHKSLFK